jgi:hypothetical protein
MSRESSLELFDALASRDKTVLGFPGDHGHNLERAQGDWARFFATRLGEKLP